MAGGRVRACDQRRQIAISPQIRLVGRFASHTTVGIALFSLVGGAAVLLNYFTNLIERVGVSPHIIMAIEGQGYFLFAVDLLCLVVFVGKEAWDFCRDIMRLRPDMTRSDFGRAAKMLASEPKQIVISYFKPVTASVRGVR